MNKDKSYNKVRELLKWNITCKLKENCFHLRGAM